MLYAALACHSDVQCAMVLFMVQIAVQEAVGLGLLLTTTSRSVCAQLSGFNVRFWQSGVKSYSVCMLLMILCCLPTQVVVVKDYGRLQQVWSCSQAKLPY